MYRIYGYLSCHERYPVYIESFPTVERAMHDFAQIYKRDFLHSVDVVCEESQEPVSRSELYNLYDKFYEGMWIFDKDGNCMGNLLEEENEEDTKSDG